MVPQLRALAALPEDPSSFHSTVIKWFTGFRAPAPGDLVPLDHKGPSVGL